jgi:hypothetical protein
MALCPFADHKLLPESGSQPAIVPRIVIDHTQAGHGSLFGQWQGSGLESTFWVAQSGTIEQYMDTEVQADANLEANRWLEGGVHYGAVSIETENSVAATQAAYHGGQGAAAFDVDPWTPEQIAALERLHDWLAHTHPQILRQRCDRPLGAGLGYHSMWGTGPTPWIPYKSRGKKCPGDARIAQWHDVLLPAFVAGTAHPIPDPKELDMDETTLRRIVGEEIDKRVNPDGKGNLLSRLRDSAAKVEKRTADLVSAKRPFKKAT